jgi:hypothetical protein
MLKNPLSLEPNPPAGCIDAAANRFPSEVLRDKESRGGVRFSCVFERRTGGLGRDTSPLAGVILRDINAQFSNSRWSNYGQT